MLLETLLLSTCFISGKTSHKDSNTTISVNKNDLQNDETLLFFHIDDQTNPCCKIREVFWGKEDGHSLCDLLVFYAKDDKRVFCFVELKDNKKDFGKATEQVISTYLAFKETLIPQFKTKYTAKAFICCSNGSLPQEHGKYQEMLKREFNNNFEHDGESKDFLNFLRGKLEKIEKKGKRK